MLICFCGSGEASKETIQRIIEEEGADELLALPSEHIEKTVISVFNKDNINHDVYEIDSWVQRVEAAVSELKRCNGKMFIFPERKETLTTHEDHIAYLCKQNDIKFEIV